ncbi:sigma-70 family RNA polymerase sigma factor [Paractinoplanes maris]|uniref:sigma-70 family RNA polymerase sigma factor n=1 Tax=Paractinoplanes maris TaxID=1734446 RepID=UPI00202212F3|nr:sigma-70 family RNA polymerase sigma factor [Actinoplanes maris]
MPQDHIGHTMPSRPVDIYDDLDHLAEQYVLDRAGLSPAQAARLRDETIRRLLPFAGRLAGRYRHGREPADDLEQVARLGLIKAVDRYDPDNGSFTAYAVSTIIGELKRYFRDHSWGLQVPRRLQDLSRVITRAGDELTAELRRPPTRAELAVRCGVSEDDVEEARRSREGYRPVSLSLPVGEGGGELGDLLGGSDHTLDLVPEQVTLRRLLDQLPARERRILLERFYGNRTQLEIAGDLGISQMHVSRLLNRTLAWLRAGMLTEETPAWPAESTDTAETNPVVTVRREPAGLRVILVGEVDQDNGPRLREVLLRLVRRAPAGSRLAIDLGGVPLLAAAGVAALLAVYEAGRGRRVEVTAVNLQPFVRRIAAVSGLGVLLRPDVRPPTESVVSPDGRWACAATAHRAAGPEREAEPHSAAGPVTTGSRRRARKPA